MIHGKLRVFRYILCVLLSLAMIIGYIPSVSMTVYADSEEEEEDPVDYLMSLDATEPSELDSYPEEVYGVEKNDPFLLARMDELNLLVTDTGNISMYKFDTFDLGLDNSADGWNWLKGINKANAESTVMMDSNKLEIYNELQSVQTVGFDRDGTGRKGYMASVGFSGNNIVLAIQDANSGTLKTIAVGEASEANSAAFWLKDNYIAITAGDYDDDGRDSIVIYYCGNGDNAKLLEYYYEPDSDKWTKREILNLSSKLVNKTYTTDGSIQYKPAVGLATGDFTGDGVDQLAYSAGFYNTATGKNSEKNGYQGYSCDNIEQFATCVGVCDLASSSWKINEPVWMYEKASKSMSSSGSIYTYPLTIMHAGMIAAGDVNNDGIDEIVAAGYMSLDYDDNNTNCARGVYDNNKLTSVSGVCNWSDKLVASVVSYNKNKKTYKKSALKTFSMSQAQKYTYVKYCRETDREFVKLSMACGSINGDSARESVFIAGILYDFSSYLPTVEYSPNIVGNNDLSATTGNTGQDSSVNWIRNVAVGNFDGNEAGREQFVFTLWQKFYKKELYASNVGVMGGVNYTDTAADGKNAYRNDTVTDFGETDEYACNLNASNITGANQPIHNGHNANDVGATQTTAGATSSYALNVVPVAVDIDNDGLMGRFRKSGYVYTDPEVIAVLQGGPYFQEIDDVDGYVDPCMTSYTISTGYGNGTSSSNNVSFEAGFAGEASAGCLKVSLEAGYSMDWSSTYERSYTATTSTTFTSKGDDVVIVRRIPQLVYSYDILKEGGNPSDSNDWINDGYSVKVSLSPRSKMLSIDEYNNELVKTFNNIVGWTSADALNYISLGDDLPGDHLGNPDNYWKNWAEVNGEQLCDGEYELGYVKGSIASGYSDETEVTRTEEMSHGFHYGLTVQGGSDFVAGEAWAGGYVSLDYSHSTGSSVTTININECGGEVENIVAETVANNSDLTVKQVQSSYGFTWTFGKWERALYNDGSLVPFFGYVVYDVKRRAFPPQLSDITDTVAAGYSAFEVSDPSLDLSSQLKVTKVSGDSHITWDSTNGIIKVAKGLSKGTYKAVFRISNGLSDLDKTFNYVFNVIGTAAKIEGPESMTIQEGYGETERSDEFNITGNPTPDVELNSLFSEITYDASTSRILVAPGLSEGSYTVYLKATNAEGITASYAFTVIVEKDTRLEDAIKVGKMISDYDVSKLSTDCDVNDPDISKIREIKDMYDWLDEYQQDYLGDAVRLKLEKAFNAYLIIEEYQQNIYDIEATVNNVACEIESLKEELNNVFDEVKDGRAYVYDIAYSQYLERILGAHYALYGIHGSSRGAAYDRFGLGQLFTDIAECHELLGRAYIYTLYMIDPNENDYVRDELRNGEADAIADAEEMMRLFIEAVDNAAGTETDELDSFIIDDLFNMENNALSEFYYEDEGITKIGRSVINNLDDFVNAETQYSRILHEYSKVSIERNISEALQYSDTVDVICMINAIEGGTALTDAEGSKALEEAVKAYEALTDEEKDMISSDVKERLEKLEAQAQAIENDRVDISGAKVKAASSVYTGKAKKPVPSVILDGVGLNKGDDFTVSYKNNIKAGTATVTVTGVGYYKGTATGTFKIRQLSISGGTVASIANKVYTGKVIKPLPVLKLKVGGSTKTLKKGTDYTLSYSNNKKVGKATITITGKGNYKGTKKVTFKIIPKSTSLKTVSALKKGFKATWTKKTTQVTGYQIQYSTKSGFPASKTKSKFVTKNKTTSLKITGLKAKTKYYVRIRTYKTVNGIKYYSKWSSKKTVKTKA